MLKTTTNHFEGKPVREYLGIVSSEVLCGANVFRDIFASIRDVFGGRSKSYEEVFEAARNQAMQEVEKKARDLGANAIVGIQFTFNAMGSKGSMIMVTVSGTAVRIDSY